MKECENYKLCKSKITVWLGKRCTGCEVRFGEWHGGKGKLKEYEKQDCPICLENTTCFEQPKCSHPICSNCFRIIYLGELPDDLVEARIGKEPENPYQHVLDHTELDYDDLKSDPEKYPLYAEWEKIDDDWLDQKEDLINELCTHKCCLCRIADSANDS